MNLNQVGVGDCKLSPEGERQCKVLLPVRQTRDLVRMWLVSAFAPPAISHLCPTIHVCLVLIIVLNF